MARRGNPGVICDHVPVDAGIKAISVPVHGDNWNGIDSPGYGTLSGDDVVLGLDFGPQPRAYPLRLLWDHEIVNDTVPTNGGDRPVLVTYYSICRSGLVADRRVTGQPSMFGVSGLLWQPSQLAGSEDEAAFGVAPTGPTDPRRKNNLVMYDEKTGSYWSQWLARAICGPLTGDTLSSGPGYGFDLV